MRKNLKSKVKKLKEKELSNIEKLFLNYKGKYKKIDLVVVHGRKGGKVNSGIEINNQI